MSAYMFQIELADMTEEMLAAIPDQRAAVNKLFIEGRIMAYSVSQQSNFLWCVVNAANEQEAMEIIAGMPLQPFFADIACHPLLFHNVIPAALPDISLN